MRHPPSVTVSRRARKRCTSFFLAALLLVLASVPAGTAVPDPPSESLPLRTLLSWNLSNQSAPHIQLSKGRFLVASRKLVDSQFSETVVLLLRYDRLGAMGLVINQPTEVKLSEILPEIEGVQQRSDLVYHGGPVAPRQLMLLIRTGNPPEQSHHVFEDIYISSSQEVIERIIKDPTAEERFRVYAGYAGWAPGQLDQEVLRGGWHILRAEPEAVFDKSPQKIWPEFIRRSSAQWVRLLWPAINVKRD